MAGRLTSQTLQIRLAFFVELCYTLAVSKREKGGLMPLMKFLVTALWHDGLANVEEHPTLFAALDFAKEALGCEGIIKVTVEKV